MSERRYQVIVGDTVEHIDGRFGLVLEMTEAGGLPAAKIRWDDRQEETIPLGYVRRAAFSTAV